MTMWSYACTILGLILAVGCGEQRVLVLREGRWTADAERLENLVLYMESPSLQRLVVKLDGVIAVDRDVRTRVRYRHGIPEKFLFSLPRGTHELEIESRTFGTRTQRQLEVKDRLWVIAGCGKQSIHITVSESPIGFL